MILSNMTVQETIAIDLFAEQNPAVPPNRYMLLAVLQEGKHPRTGTLSDSRQRLLSRTSRRIQDERGLGNVAADRVLS